MQGAKPTDGNLERALQIDMLRIQMRHAYHVAYEAAYFGVGASFEVFSLTLLLTALLLAKMIDPVWWALITLYLVTGVGFVAYGVLGFARTKRKQEADLDGLAKRYL